MINIGRYFFNGIDLIYWKMKSDSQTLPLSPGWYSALAVTICTIQDYAMQGTVTMIVAKSPQVGVFSSVFSTAVTAESRLCQQFRQAFQEVRLHNV